MFCLYRTIKLSKGGSTYLNVAIRLVGTHANSLFVMSPSLWTEEKSVKAKPPFVKGRLEDLPAVVQPFVAHWVCRSTFNLIPQYSLG